MSLTFADLAVEFQCCAASIERAAEHWFTEGQVVPAVLASAAVPGLLPPARVGDEHYLDGGIVNSIPVGRAVQLGADRIFVLQVGRVDRPLRAPRKPWEVARVSFEIARRHRFVREMAELPDGVQAHVLPAGGSEKDDAPTAFRNTGLVAGRIETAYEQSLAYLERAPLMPAPVAWFLQRFVVAPLMIVLTVLMWTTLPLWLVGAGLLSPFVPGWLRPVRLLWLGVVHMTLESIALVELFGLWIASGFGWRIRSPYFERIHYDIVQAYLVVFFRESRRVLRLKIETVGPAPDAYPGQPLLVVLPSCRTGRLVHADLRPDALVPPRAPGGAQGHPGLGPRHRRAAEPAAQPVHLAEPGLGQHVGVARWASWPATSTRTTAS